MLIEPYECKGKTWALFELGGIAIITKGLTLQPWRIAEGTLHQPRHRWGVPHDSRTNISLDDVDEFIDDYFPTAGATLLIGNVGFSPDVLYFPERLGPLPNVDMRFFHEKRRQSLL